jgi:GMP synthase-like glutamine amidotransferase
MPPVLILQHLSADGPAYLGTWLQRAGVPFEVRNAQAGDPFPQDLNGYSALAVLGGEMSANDPLPSLRQAERLILEGMASGKPVIGHCLGGQLMARALGQRIGDSPAPEVGWQPLTVVDTPEAADWFGAAGERVVFQWHFEAFDLPPGAARLAGSAVCPNQAFAIRPHLALQFHVEIDADKLGRWSHEQGQRHDDAVRRHPQTVQNGAAMRAASATHLAAHQALADRLYARWLGARP